MLGSYCDSWQVSFKIHIIRTVIHLFIYTIGVTLVMKY
jgi:hypothetical protein